MTAPPRHRSGTRSIDMTMTRPLNHHRQRWLPTFAGLIVLGGAAVLSGCGSGTDESAAARRGPDELAASHILVAYKGTRNAPAGITRTREEAHERARRIAYLPQHRDVHWGVTTDAVVALGRFAYGQAGHFADEDRAAVDRAMTAAGAAHLKGRTITALSGGEGARVHLARALAGETPVLVVDEPTAALDPRHQLAIMSILKARAENGGLVIAALHDLNLAARYCSRMLVLQDGAIAADGPPMDVLDTDLVARVFGVSAIVQETDGARLMITGLADQGH